MKLKIKKRRVLSLLREAEFFEVLVNAEFSEADENLFDRYFNEDFTISLHVDGARERGHSLTSSRPKTRVKFNLKKMEPLQLLFAHESDANVFVERLKEQASILLKMMRDKTAEETSFDEDTEFDI